MWKFTILYAGNFCGVMSGEIYICVFVCWLICIIIFVYVHVSMLKSLYWNMRLDLCIYVFICWHWEMNMYMYMWICTLFYDANLHSEILDKIYVYTSIFIYLQIYIDKSIYASIYVHEYASFHMTSIFTPKYYIYYKHWVPSGR